VTARLALLAIAAAVLAWRLHRRTVDDVRPMEGSASWDDADVMCGNCQTPWKCNGPHVIEETEWYRRTQPATAGRH